MKIQKGIKGVVITIIFVVIAIEIILRCLYFQTGASRATAFGFYYEKFHNTIDIRETFKRLVSFQPLDPLHKEKFFDDPAYEEDRDKIFTLYEQIFTHFIERSEEIGAFLVVLYVPEFEGGKATVREFLKSVATDNVPYLNADSAFARFKRKEIYKEGYVKVLTSFGHQVLAKYLYDNLAQFLTLRTLTQFDVRPDLFGDLSPSIDSLWEEGTGKEYHVVTNSQGLRRSEDIVVPKPDDIARIVCIGGSVTFGQYVDAGSVYVDLLERSLDGVEVINAGMLNYTICDELSYLEDKGQYMQPDIIVLQVTDDDLYGLHPHVQKKHCRGGKFCIK